MTAVAGDPDIIANYLGVSASSTLTRPSLPTQLPPSFFSFP